MTEKNEINNITIHNEGDDFKNFRIVIDKSDSLPDDMKKIEDTIRGVFEKKAKASRTAGKKFEMLAAVIMAFSVIIVALSAALGADITSGTACLYAAATIACTILFPLRRVQTDVTIRYIKYAAMAILFMAGCYFLSKALGTTNPVLIFVCPALAIAATMGFYKVARVAKDYSDMAFASKKIAQGRYNIEINEGNKDE